jgi:branched-chain amino acid aminotransferase
MIWLNGRLMPRDQAHIDPADRGFLLADGLFETIRAYRGHLFRVEDHLQRLAAGAAEIGIPLPVDPTAIAGAAAEVIEANQLGQGDAALRITLTRGTGNRGLPPPEDPLPSLLITAGAYHAPLQHDGFIAICAAGVARNEASMTSRLKTLGYLDSVLAQGQAARQGADEAILSNAQGRIACGARSNLFVVMDGRVLTPAVAEGALPGITRHIVLGLCTELGIAAEEGQLLRESLHSVTEAFVTNSLLEVMPLRRLDGRELPIGPVTKQLMEAYAALTPR